MNCPQAWHGGLQFCMLIECKYQEKHRGKHRNAAGDLEWSGKLTEQEMDIAEKLRGKTMSEEVTVTHLPDCDICKSNSPDEKPEPAAYDGRTTFGPWANMCEFHWQQFGIGRLGTGFGQRLILQK